MICGALQTLNEEACEDVLDEADEQMSSSLQVPDSGQCPVIIIIGDSDSNSDDDLFSGGNE